MIAQVKSAYSWSYFGPVVNMLVFLLWRFGGKTYVKVWRVLSIDLNKLQKTDGSSSWPFVAIVGTSIALAWLWENGGKKIVTPYFGELYLQNMISWLLLTWGGWATGRHGRGKKVKNGWEDERGWGVSSTIASCPEKSIHHFHVFMSWLTLAIARSVATMTPRIDEVQAGVASRGLGWRWSNQMWSEVGLGWARRGTWWRSWCYSPPPLNISTCRHNHECRAHTERVYSK